MQLCNHVRCWRISLLAMNTQAFDDHLRLMEPQNSPFCEFAINIINVLDVERYWILHTPVRPNHQEL